MPRRKASLAAEAIDVFETPLLGRWRSSSLRMDVQSWISGIVPDQAHHLQIKRPHKLLSQPERPSRKHKLDFSTSTVTKRTRKTHRDVLQETSGNPAPSAPRRRRLVKSRLRPQDDTYDMTQPTAAVALELSRGRTGSFEHARRTSLAVDEDATPRPHGPVRPSQLPQPISPTRNVHSRTSKKRKTESRSTSSRDDTSRDDASTDSRRSSPSKKPTSLYNLPKSIIQRPIESISKLPTVDKALIQLWQQMDYIADGVAIVPSEAWTEVKVLGHQFKDQQQYTFDQTGSRRSLGATPDIDFIKEMIFLTNDCIADSATEHAWNSFVHGPMLTKAISKSAYRQAIRAKDISVCAIHPASLLPPDTSSLKIDYALALTREKRFSEALQDLDLLDGADPSLNALNEPALASWPICVGLEAKPAGEGANKAGVQLSIFAYATLHRIQRLQDQFGRERTPIAELPLLLVQGETWKLRVAVMAEDGSVEVLHHSQDIGKSSNAKGVLQIIMAIQLLARWGVARWKPWFEQNVLPRSREPLSRSEE